jgi:hypothetical protein
MILCLRLYSVGATEAENYGKDFEFTKQGREKIIQRQA